MNELILSIIKEANEPISVKEIKSELFNQYDTYTDRTGVQVRLNRLMKLSVIKRKKSKTKFEIMGVKAKTKIFLYEVI